MPEGDSLFRTARALQRHDGLQIDLPVLGKPFGFAVERLWTVSPGRRGQRQDVFQASAGALVEVSLPREHPDRVADWYRQSLAEPPWSLANDKLNRRESVPGRPTWKRYCLEAAREEVDGARRTYYWEIMGYDQDRQTVWVNVSTPRPNNAVCQPYVNQPPT